jgi:thiamine kinase-like enzyme
VSVAAAHGLEVGEAHVLSDRSNVLVALAPTPVVARVATSTADARAGGARDWLARDVAVATWLARRGAAVVPPASELPPGPHVEDGLAITFWRHEEHDRSAPASPREAEEALRALHEALEGYPGDLPPFTALLDECEGLLDRLASAAAAEGGPAAVAKGGPAAAGPASLAALEAASAALARVRSAIDSAGLPARPLHGDASRGNLLRTPAGLLWTDFEDCCAGPVEWDLACLASSGGTDASTALGPFLEARRLQGALWTALLAERHPDLRTRAADRLQEWEGPG